MNTLTKIYFSILLIGFGYAYYNEPIIRGKEGKNDGTDGMFLYFVYPIFVFICTVVYLLLRMITWFLLGN